MRAVARIGIWLLGAAVAVSTAAPADPIDAGAKQVLLNGSAASAPANEAGATLSFAQSHHDFGPLIGAQEARHRFSFTNTGASSLEIAGVTSCCGCTARVLGKSTLAPGEHGEIEVMFTGSGLRGPVDRVVEVRSNDLYHPSHKLTFVSDVTPELYAEPAQLDFTEVRGRAPQTLATRIKSGHGLDVQLTGIDVQGAPFLSATFGRDAKDGTVQLSFDPKKLPAGAMGGALAIEVTTADPAVPTLVIPVRWSLRQTIVAQPGAFRWSEAAGEEYTGVVTLLHSDRKPFRITGSSLAHSWIKVKLDGNSKAANEQSARIVIPKSTPPGKYQETLVLQTDDQDQPEIAVPVTLELRERSTTR